MAIDLIVVIFLAVTTLLNDLHYYYYHLYHYYPVGDAATPATFLASFTLSVPVLSLLFSSSLLVQSIHRHTRLIVSSEERAFFVYLVVQNY